MTHALTPDDGWHVSPQLRRAWITGTCADEQAWSVEAHLSECAICRQDVARHLASAVADIAGNSGPRSVRELVDDVHLRLVDLPEQVPLRPASVTRRWRALLGLRQVGLTWAVVLVALLAGATILDLLAGSRLLGGAPPTAASGAAAWFAGGGSWVAAVAPILPVLGVALAYGPGLDPAHEMTAATPVAGLRLVLWRTAGVLLTTVPAALVLELVVAANRQIGSSTPHPTRWLLPALGLTLVVLALGSRVGTAMATAGVASLWVLGVVAPLGTEAAPLLLTDVPPAFWALLAGGAGLVLVLRRDRLDALHSPPHHGGLA